MTRCGACRSGLVALASCAAFVLTACGNHTMTPSPRTDPNLQVTPIDSSGPIRISFVSANIPPGSTVAGCGNLIEGCASKLRVTLRLDPPTDGPVLYARIYLHATNLIACLWGETVPFAVQAGVPSTIEIPLDRAEGCGTPIAIATMAAVIEGPIQVASRQTWSLHYVSIP
jgi:hypothetical protein